MKLYTAAEVEAHNKDETRWIVNDGYVYDLHAFYAKTPNGAQIIKDMALEDPDALYRLLDSYIVGELMEFRQDMAAANINAKVTKVALVLAVVSVLAVALIVYHRRWIWLAFAAIIIAEFSRRLYNLREDLLEEIGIHSD